VELAVNFHAPKPWHRNATAFRMIAMQPHPHHRAFSVVELLATSVAIVIVFCCTMALSPQQRNQGDIARTQANLKHLGVASMTYAAEFNDRQMTLVNDNLSTYGMPSPDQPDANDDQQRLITRCVENFATKTGSPHPAIPLGHTTNPQGQGEIASLKMDDPSNHWALFPVSFDAKPRGWFRLVNARPMSAYLNGRFYDPIYYAPNDQAAINAARFFFDKQEEYTSAPNNQIFWSSYCFSPAALWSPKVLSRPADDGTGGFTDPFSIPNSFKCPGVSQAMYANLKSHIMEHHWLHNRPEGTRLCNPKREKGTYNNCEPYCFNHAIQSAPMAVYFDGHVDNLPVKDAIDSDARIKQQTKSEIGLWN
jgi:hypothetical protein